MTKHDPIDAISEMVRLLENNFCPQYLATEMTLLPELKTSLILYKPPPTKGPFTYKIPVELDGMETAFPGRLKNSRRSSFI